MASRCAWPVASVVASLRARGCRRRRRGSNAGSGGVASGDPSPLPRTGAPSPMTETAPARPEGSDLVPGWLIRLAAVGWRLLAAIALAFVLLQIVVTLWTVTASILIAGVVA